MIQLENLTLQVLSLNHDTEEFDDNLEPIPHITPLCFICTYQKKKYFVEYPGSGIISIKLVTSLFLNIKIVSKGKSLSTFDVSFQDLETSTTSKLEKTISQNNMTIVLAVSADRKLKFTKSGLPSSTNATPVKPKPSQET
jgi:hypothetical protein